MPVLLMAMTLAAAAPEALPGPPPRPEWIARPLRATILARAYGDVAMFEGEAVYDSGPVRIRGAAAYETHASPLWRDRMSVSLSAGGQVSPHERLELELRHGLTRASGGFGAAVTLRRAFGR
jgi:hypothetical protein